MDRVRTASKADAKRCGEPGRPTIKPGRNWIDAPTVLWRAWPPRRRCGDWSDRCADLRSSEPRAAGRAPTPGPRQRTAAAKNSISVAWASPRAWAPGQLSVAGLRSSLVPEIELAASRRLGPMTKEGVPRREIRPPSHPSSRRGGMLLPELPSAQRVAEGPQRVLEGAELDVLADGVWTGGEDDLVCSG